MWRDDGWFVELEGSAIAAHFVKRGNDVVNLDEAWLKRYEPHNIEALKLLAPFLVEAFETKAIMAFKRDGEGWFLIER